MRAHVVVKVSVSERGVNKLAALTELLESAMDVQSMDVQTAGVERYGSSGSATFVGYTELSLSRFTAALYGSQLSGLVRDVGYTVNKGMPLTDLQARNQELLDTDTD